MTALVPQSWMPTAAMRRIHVHWTAGGHTANATDKKSYHIIVQGDGTLVRGDKSIAGNAPGSSLPRASHTLNANTGAIGVSMACMAGAKESPFSSGSSPMTQAQWQAMMTVVAELSLQYGILVTPQTILTHAEVQPLLGILQNNKWDVTRLSFDPDVRGHAAVGALMRAGVAAERDRITGAPSGPPGPLPEEMKLPRMRVFGVAPSTLNFRASPGGEKKGELPEGVVVERLAIWQDWAQVRTPGGFVGWVATAFLKAVGDG